MKERTERLAAHLDIGTLETCTRLLQSRCLVVGFVARLQEGSCQEASEARYDQFHRGKPLLEKIETCGEFTIFARW